MSRAAAAAQLMISDSRRWHISHAPAGATATWATGLYGLIGWDSRGMSGDIHTRLDVERRSSERGDQRRSMP